MRTRELRDVEAEWKAQKALFDMSRKMLSGAETRASRPDPGTDTTDNDLHRPRSGP